MAHVKVHSLFTEFDINLFKSGKHYRLYEKLGSHLVTVDGIDGVYFAVWAPSAKAVAVAGNFNDWDFSSHSLNARLDQSGIEWVFCSVHPSVHPLVGCFFYLSKFALHR